MLKKLKIWLYFETTEIYEILQCYRAMLKNPEDNLDERLFFEAKT